MESPPVDAGAPAAGGGAGGGLASRLMKSALSQALSGRRESENKAQEEATRARLAEVRPAGRCCAAPRPARRLPLRSAATVARRKRSGAPRAS